MSIPNLKYLRPRSVSLAAYYPDIFLQTRRVSRSIYHGTGESFWSWHMTSENGCCLRSQRLLGFLTLEYGLETYLTPSNSSYRSIYDTGWWKVKPGKHVSLTGIIITDASSLSIRYCWRGFLNTGICNFKPVNWWRPLWKGSIQGVYRMFMIVVLYPSGYIGLLRIMEPEIGHRTGGEYN